MNDLERHAARVLSPLEQQIRSNRERRRQQEAQRHDRNAKVIASVRAGKTGHAS